MSTEFQRFGKYELHKRINRTANGEFWKGYDPESKRPVGIKVYYINQQVDSDFIAQFAKRMEILTSMHHPNIIPIHDFYIVPSKNPDETAASMACLITDYMEGQTLADYIRATPALGKLPPGADILHLYTSLSMAIDYAHQNGVIHGNIKPSNILLDKYTSSQSKLGEPLLTHFELSSLLRNSNNSSVPIYLSPEQIKGYPANERSDVYALGIILYELCTGVLPFRGNRSVAIMMQHINALPTPPALLNPTITPALTNVVMRSLAKDPDIRFASASSMTVGIAKALNMPVPENLSRSAYLLDLLSDSEATRPHRATVLPRMVQPLDLTSQFDQSTLSQSGWPWSSVSTMEADKTTEKPVRDHTTRERSLSAHARPTPITPLPPTEPFSDMNRRSSFYKTWIIVLTIFILLSSISTAVATFFLSHRDSPAVASPIVGHAFFVNDGQLTDTTNQGINSALQIDLSNIPNPPSGTSYYCWLLGDKNETTVTPILLGRLALDQGAVHLVYPGDQHHDNLLGSFSRLLITVDSTRSTVSNPLLDTGTWRYYAEIPQTPIPGDALHFSMLDHLRHLLVESPELKIRQLHGGPAIWLVRNTSSVLDLANSAADDWHNKDTRSLHAQLIRMLDYIDGASYVYTDVPAGPPLLIDPVTSQVPLLGPTPQNPGPPGFLYSGEAPPGYVYLVSIYLNGVIQAPEITQDQHQLATQITMGLGKLKSALEQIHQDAKQLVTLSSSQLVQPSSLSILNDLAAQVQYAYAGQLDPSTGQPEGGALWIYSNLQRLAAFVVKPLSGSSR